MNCRLYEEKVFPSEKVSRVLEDHYIEARLHTDGSKNIERILELQEELTQSIATPFYLVIEPQSKREVIAWDRGVVTSSKFTDFLERACRVPRHLACFDGHVPGFPVVPGVLQLGWAMELAAELLEDAPCLDEIEFLKFPAPLRPGDSFRINVRIVDESHVAFRIASDDLEYARGRVCLAAGPRTGR